MALVDVDFKFLWIDVGSDESSNDASIYNGSELNEGMESPNNIFNLHEDKFLPVDDVPVPYYIVGDNAFGINKRLMNPLPSETWSTMRDYLTTDSPEQGVYWRISLVFWHTRSAFC